jgi:hypothetical protein
VDFHDVVAAALELGDVRLGAGDRSRDLCLRHAGRFEFGDDGLPVHVADGTPAKAGASIARVTIYFRPIVALAIDREDCARYLSPIAAPRGT